MFLVFLVADLQKHTIALFFFLVSGKLFGSRWEGQEFLKKQKTEETKHCCLYVSEESRPEKTEKTLLFV